ncbi:MAG: hypothetical protein MJ025_04870 [Victivallaceae bacterium]|nr:hypothetical protein [Victivallaceae bacterium]
MFCFRDYPLGVPVVVKDAGDARSVLLPGMRRTAHAGGVAVYEQLAGFRQEAVKSFQMPGQGVSPIR